VLLKKRARSGSETEFHLSTTRHPNLVNLLAFFEHDHAINLVYECMQVSLSHIQVSPYSSFAEYELAAICKEVIPDMITALASAELGLGLTWFVVYS
jgi:serine/threonine protein kinase